MGPLGVSVLVRLLGFLSLLEYVSYPFSGALGLSSHVLSCLWEVNCILTSLLGLSGSWLCLAYATFWGRISLKIDMASTSLEVQLEYLYALCLHA